MFHASVEFGPSRATVWVSNVHESPTSHVGRSVEVRASGPGAGGADIGIRRRRGTDRKTTLKTAPHLAIGGAMRLQIKGLLVLVLNPAPRGKL